MTGTSDPSKRLSTTASWAAVGLASQRVVHLASDLKVLAGCDNEGADTAPGGAHVPVAVWLGVSVGVDTDTEERQTLGRLGSYLRGVFADTAAEHERVESTHCRSHRSDTASEAMGVHRKRQDRSLITGFDPTKYDPHVGATSKGQKAPW